MKDIFIGIIITLLIVLTISCTTYNVMFGVGTQQDVDYPEVYVTSPHNTDCVPGTFNVKGYAVDRGGIARIVVEYSDCDGLKRIVDCPSTGDFDIPLNLYAQNISTGDFTLSVTAVDIALHKTTVFLNITVDKEPPAITLFTPAEDEFGGFRDTLVGNVIFSGIVSDNYAIKTSSPNNLIRIYEEDDETNVIFRRQISGSPFQISGFDTMDESHIAGDYVMCMSFEDVNGNIGKKIISLSTAKGDTATYLTVDAPLRNGIFTDAMTIAGYVSNDFIPVERVDYKITFHNQSERINSGTVGSIDVGVAGSFSKIISLKKLLKNVESHQFDLHLTAIASDGSVSDTKVIPFEFNKDLADYEFIDESEHSIVPGKTPLMSSYINGEFDVEFAARSSLYDILYSIVQNGTTLVEYTSLNNAKQTADDVTKYSVHISPSAIGLQSGSFNILGKAAVSEDGAYRPVSRVVYYDNIAPQLIITSPENVSAINGALTIAGTAHDNLGLQNVWIKENDYSDSEYKAVSGMLALWSYIVARDDTTDDITVEQKYGISEDETKDISFTVKAVDYAGNESLADITVTVNPAADKPVITILNPPADDLRSSGSLSVSAVITDDDYPSRGVTAKMAVYKYEEGLDSPYDYIEIKDEIVGKTFEILTEQGDLNLSDIIQTEDDKFQDLSKYVIILTGSGWKMRNAEPKMRTFQVDKSAPSVVVENYDDSVPTYFTDTIHFGGYVKYKQNSLLVDDMPLVLQYQDSTGSVRAAVISLGSIDTVSDGGMLYNTQSFDITIGADGSTSGFVVGKEPTLSWSDDKWGNSNKLFTFRATSTTAVQGYKTCRMHLDNHQPAAVITAPENNCLFREPEVQSFDLMFAVDDKPADGDEAVLNMSNVLIEYKFAEDDHWSTLLDYGAGSKGTSLTGTVGYRVDFNKIITDGVGHQLRLTVKDFAGNTSVPQILTFNKNTKPPVVETFRINNANVTNYYKGNISFQIKAGDSYGAPDDGIRSLTLYADGQAVAVRNNVPDGITDLTVDTTAFSDGVHVFTVEVIDNSDIAVTNRTYGIDDVVVTIDNTKPELNMCQLLSMGAQTNEFVAVDKWTAYVGLKLSAEDNISLYAMSPTVKIGTAAEGDDILGETTLVALMNGITSYSCDYTNWIDLFEMLGDRYETTDKIYVTVTVTDVAGNVQKTVKPFDKGISPNIAFDKAAMFAYSCTSSLNMTGTYDSAAIGKVWIRVGTSDWNELKSANVNAAAGTWSKSLTKATYFPASGVYTVYVRAMSSDKTSQVIISRKFIVDVKKPTVTISGIQPYSVETGRVSSDNKKLSGKIKISGTYNDDMADSLGDVSDAGLTLSIGSVTKDITNITRNYSGTSWDWYYVWDTQDTEGGFLSEVTGAELTLVCTGNDIAGTTATATKGMYAVVPYVTGVEGVDGSVYPVRSYKSSKWQNLPANQKYSAAVGTTVEIRGFNLKQDSTEPTVKRGDTNIELTASSMNSLRFVIGESWQSDYINIAVNGIPTDNTVYLNVWAFSCLDRNGYNDTLDAEGYDATLLTEEITLNGKATNHVFVTFARNHKIPNEYTDADYCGFSFCEGSESPAANFAYKDESNRIVDPVFYTAVAKTNDDSFMVMFTYDEFDSLDDTYTRFGTIGRAGNRGTFYNMNGGLQNSDCIKSAKIVYNETNEIYYVACYDDQSRSLTPSPQILFKSFAAAGDMSANVVGSYTGYYDLTCFTPDGGSTYCPVLVCSDNSKMYLKYAVVPEPSSLTESKFSSVANIKYIACASMLSGSGIHISYQDENNSLVYRCAPYDSSFSVNTAIKLENAETEINGVKEGITGAFTDIDVSNGTKTKGGVTYEAGSPHISYINSSRLNTVSALRYARSSSVTGVQAGWEYMVVPSPVAVGSGNTVIKTDVSGNPIIIYKGNNRLYTARLRD